MATAESTLAQFNATGAAPVYACRAWVNFNGTGTVAIRASGNVSSIADNGVGTYTVIFITAMTDVDYSVVGVGQSGSAVIISVNAGTGGASPLTTTQAPIRCSSITPTATDSGTICVAVFR
jgi:hypothetical protein